MLLPVRSRTPTDFGFEKAYLCGEFYGFITDAALSGVFRQQNNNAAVRAGYAITKWPYVPLSGAIVRDRGHQVLELYEGLYQFSSGRAAASFRKIVRTNSGKAASYGVPGGFAAYTGILGANANTDEHVIRIDGQRGDYVVTVSIRGGRSLAWKDVAPYWNVILHDLDGIQT